MNSIKFYSDLEKFPLSEFGKHFSNFRKTAFRLEQLSMFNVEEEREAIQKIRSGEPMPEDFNKEWLDILLSAQTAGKEFSRVRVIDGKLTEYQKFEINWGYKRSIKFGEDIRFIIRPEISLFETPVPITKDFWLFDEQHCFLMEYDYCGTFLGVTKVPDDSVQLYVDLMNETKGASIPFDEATKTLGL